MILKGKKRSILGAFFVLILVISAQSQAIRLTGKITNAKTGEPIYLCHVRVGDIVSYTNEDGDFSLRIPSASKGKLEAFHLGFDTFEAPIKTDGTYDVKLEPVEPTKSISDTITAETVMKHVFLRIHMNYETAEQLLLSYYKESVTTTGEQIYYIGEGILEEFLPSDMDKGPAMVRPLKTRTRFVKPYGHKGVDDLSGHATEMVQSTIWMDDSFLGDKNRGNYKFAFDGMEVHRDEHVYIISFEPTNGKGNVKGKIYVDETSYAIIRIECSSIKSEQWLTETWVEEFQHHNHTYYLLRASHETTWKDGDADFTYSSLIINTEVEPNSKNIAWEKFLLGKQFYFTLENTGKFTDDFWGNYNYIPLDNAERSQLIK